MFWLLGNNTGNLRRRADKRDCFFAYHVTIRCLCGFFIGYSHVCKRKIKKLTFNNFKKFFLQKIPRRARFCKHAKYQYELRVTRVNPMMYPPHIPNRTTPTPKLIMILYVVMNKRKIMKYFKRRCHLQRFFFLPAHI